MGAGPQGKHGFSGKGAWGSLASPPVAAAWDDYDKAGSLVRRQYMRYWFFVGRCQ